MWRFRIEALADPQALPRIVDQFAQRAVVPTRVTADCEGDRMHCAVSVGPLEPLCADLIAEKLRTIVVVASVAIEHAVGASGVDNIEVASNVSDQA